MTLSPGFGDQCYGTALLGRACGDCGWSWGGRRSSSPGEIFLAKCRTLWKTKPLRRDQKVAVVGSGPNGLAAARRLALSGIKVSLYEARDSLGGSVRSVPDNRYPEISHDWGASAFPLTLTSPAFAGVDWGEFGIDWLNGNISFSHALPQSRGLFAYRDLNDMTSYLGEDGPTWRRLFLKRSQEIEDLSEAFLDRRSLHSFNNSLLRFGPKALYPAIHIARRFPSGKDGVAGTLFGTVANHSQLSLQSFGSSGIGLMLISAAHAVGWPIPRGGTGRITEALVALVVSLGVAIQRGHPISDPRELGSFDAVLWTTHPSALGGVVDLGLRKKVSRRLTSWGGSGVSVTKLDFVVEGPVPWGNVEHGLTPIVHLGGSFANMLDSKNRVRAGLYPRIPYMILSQPGVLDKSRWFEGMQPVSVYLQHPPQQGLEAQLPDVLSVTNQIEESAPGFASRVRSVRETFPSDFEAQNPSIKNGDIFGGASSFVELLTGPAGLLHHYRLGNSHHFLGSSGTWPGTGVHGMSGYNAANHVLRALMQEA